MIQLSQKTATGSAHGKLILTGEHAVVYGMPAIALPFPLVKAVSTVEEIADESVISCEYYDGPLNQVPEKLRGIAACIKEALKVLHKPQKGLWIRLNTSIPIGRGLGSSAAIAMAVVKSLYSFYGAALSQKDLMTLVHIAESYAHGNPSGIDTAAVSSDFPIWFQRGKRLKQLQLARPLFMVIADTGRIGDTHSAVSIVRKNYKYKPESTKKSLKQLGYISLETKNALVNGNVNSLGSLMNRAHTELSELGVSDNGIDKLVHAARKEGALGAKLTGGGRGGCMMALAHNLTQSKEIANALMKAGARNAWYFKLKTD
ncbi:mevalonate kinase [Bacillus sp. REN16]|uniref:mevalonate kinase n=1 Tax=Bacillus sp. REN16 TaxID=2887296 RepID=UPI001E3B6E7F|nr:mevalonate kinase [Bacillus sp. REN16]MCC3357145.1 mevalonate kinase [Bacillus sp. REN16]